MALLTLATARSQVRSYLDRPLTAKTPVTEAEINIWLDHANKEVWRQLATTAPMRLFDFGAGALAWVDVAYPAGAVSVDVGDRLLRVTGLVRTDAAGPISQTNVPFPIQNVDEVNADLAGMSKVYRYTFLQGNLLAIVPVPQVALYLHIRGLPTLPDALAVDADLLLGGVVEEYHECVVLRAAEKACIKLGDGGRAGVLQAQYDRLMTNAVVEMSMRPSHRGRRLLWRQRL